VWGASGGHRYPCSANVARTMPTPRREMGLTPKADLNLTVAGDHPSEQYLMASSGAWRRSAASLGSRLRPRRDGSAPGTGPRPRRGERPRARGGHRGHGSAANWSSPCSRRTTLLMPLRPGGRGAPWWKLTQRCCHSRRDPSQPLYEGGGCGAAPRDLGWGLAGGRGRWGCCCPSDVALVL